MHADKKRIAVVGSGISGLGAVHILKDAAQVTLFEKNTYLGGHSRTLEVEVDGQHVPVDTGFIVYNERNYPLLTALFNDLQLPTVKSDMSFGVSIENGWLEYASNGLSGLFGSLRNLTSPGMWKLVRDILRFNRQAQAFMNADPSVTLGMLLDELRLGEWFRNYYLLPMGGSIWSCPTGQMLKFPAATFIRFFDNHGLLTVSDHPQWYSVLGGSKEYVQRLRNQWENSVETRPGATCVRRDDHGGVTVTDTSGREERFDEVILASHPDESLRMVQSPTRRETELLSAFRYQPNEVILHTDESFMPRRRSAWASWVYQSSKRQDNAPAISLSYWMNNLQNLGTDVPIIVTLNPMREPAPDKILDRHVFDHPVFDEKAIRAQGELMEIQGADRIWYCGAWQRNGFHEDGQWSAVRVAAEMGVDVPWS